mmetsp:Transcript_51950/g.161170  ORF Transcript_51950/g.161170 Transcript_51950/m.161170 type:complete len:242 (-) Transcript_51950:269-994(-)
MAVGHVRLAAHACRLQARWERRGSLRRGACAVRSGLRGPHAGDECDRGRLISAQQQRCVQAAVWAALRRGGGGRGAGLEERGPFGAGGARSRGQGLAPEGWIASPLELLPALRPGCSQARLCRCRCDEGEAKGGHREEGVQGLRLLQGHRGRAVGCQVGVVRSAMPPGDRPQRHLDCRGHKLQQGRRAHRRPSRIHRGREPVLRVLLRGVADQVPGLQVQAALPQGQVVHLRLCAGVDDGC